MKTICTIAALFFATAATAQTIDFDGCVGVKVEGTNYYNLVDPRCKTASSEYESSERENDARDALRDAEEAAG